MAQSVIWDLWWLFADSTVTSIPMLELLRVNKAVGKMWADMG